MREIVMDVGEATGASAHSYDGWWRDWRGKKHRKLELTLSALAPHPAVVALLVGVDVAKFKRK